MKRKYYEGVVGGYDGFTILMKEECSVYENSPTPQFTKVDYYTCDLKKGAFFTPNVGFIEVDNVDQTDENIKVTFSYGDSKRNIKNAIISLGQKIVFNIPDNDDNYNNYFVSRCHLMITTKEFAKEKIASFYNDKDKSKQYIKQKRDLL